MKSFKEMTREQLARLIVMDQVVRGVTSMKNAKVQVKIRLEGGFGVKPMTKSEMVNYCERNFNN